MLGTELSFTIADTLSAQRIPFVFVTACDPTIVPERHRQQPLIDKMDLVAQLVATCSAVRAAATIAGPRVVGQCTIRSADVQNLSLPARP